MRRTLAILCSGQGGQHRGMFDVLGDLETAQPIFEQAHQVMGEDPRTFVKQASSDELYSNRNGQILCCTQAMAAWLALKDSFPSKVVLAGYSVGELAIWGCGGMLSPESIVPLAKQRADLMDKASPNNAGLSGIVGLRREELESFFDGKELYIAIVNGIDSFVVGGLRHDLEKLCETAREHGANRAVMLHVAVPSHTPLLQSATPKFAAVLEQASPKPASSGFRVLAGIDGGTLWTASDGIEKLSKQISHTVEWSTCLQSCQSAGAVAALELGPGSSLSKMASHFFPGDSSRSIEDFQTIQGVKAWIGRVVR